MSTVISTIVKKIATTTAAAGLAVGLLGGGVAYARELTFQQRVEAEMLQGKDYSAAWSAASRGLNPSTSPELAARGLRAESAQNAGQDYVDANRTAGQFETPAYSPTAVAKAQRVQAALNEGKDYVAAWAAGDKAPAAPTATVGVTTTASVRSAR